MNEYKKRVLQARNEFIKLNFEQEKELFKIYNDSGNKLIGKILNMTDSRTKIHNIETYKIINEYRAELFHNLNKAIENNIYKSSDIQKGVQLSFVDMIAPDVKINEALKRTVTKISSDSVKQLIAGEYYKDGKTLSKRIWNITGDNGNKIDAIIKDNIAKGANVKELAKELDKYVNPKNRITTQSFKAGMDSNKISYQAQRLARTSITHAQTETLIQNAKKNPFCKGLKWNLSASHYSRMHGKMDECDDYNGRTFKPEEVPLQHPNCLCYFTEVLEDFDKCIETMNNCSNGKKNPNIDEWIKAGDDKTSIKITTPDKIQTKMENNKTIDDSKINNTVDYMSNRFAPKFGENNNMKLGKLSINVKKVLNSEFDMWTDLDATNKNKAVKLYEKKLKLIKDKLPDGLYIPSIVIINFEKIGINDMAGGIAAAGYNREKDSMFINNELDTEYKISKYLKDNEGQFANTNTNSSILHELGHKYHYYLVDLIAKQKNISYNKSKELFDNRIAEYICENDKIPDRFIENQLSRYAASEFKGETRINEIIAEYFTIKDNESKTDLIKFIDNYIKEVIKGEGVQ